MKKISLCFTVLILLGMAVAVSAAEDITRFKTCKICGMDREMFAYSRIYVEYAQGEPLGVCSVHCLAVDMAMNLDRVPKAIWVGDVGTKQLIDAEKAVWVIGGKKQGVMTKRGKWAFADQSAALAFIKEQGGELASFDDVLKASYVDMYEDNSMIRERRAAKRKAMEQQKPPQP